VWECIIDPSNMHHWIALTDPVTGFDRPLQPGDRLTLWRRDFVRRHSEESLVEEVRPYRSFRVRPVWPSARRMDVTATLSLEQAADPGMTWIEERISFSLGNGPVLRWLDRWLVNPVFALLIRRASGKAFRRLAEFLSGGDAGREATSGPWADRASAVGSRP
jgi:hypothetical protein